MASSTGRRGSVRQEANGTWSFVVDSTDPDGKRRQTRRRGFKSRRTAHCDVFGHRGRMSWDIVDGPGFGWGLFIGAGSRLRGRG